MAKDEGKKSFVLYCNQYKYVSKLSDEQAGILFKHIYRYVNDEKPADPEDGMVSIAWEAIKDQLQKDLESYRAKCVKNKENIEKRWNEKNNNPIQPNTNEYERKKTYSDNDNDIDIDIVNDIEDTNVSNNINKPSAKACKHKFGKYGRVLLTDEEHSKLIAEFGESKINAQIELLDEYIESNGNKNKYKNFNLVLRKSIRENWFSKGNTSTKNSNFTSLQDVEIQWEGL